MTRLKVFAGFFLVLLLSLSTVSKAQPQLPDMASATQKGLVVLGWTAQWDGIKSIAVQRSSDSVYNFTTIGYVKNLKKGPQGFIDGHLMPGKNYYRLYIAFASDLTWASNRTLVVVDSAQILAAGVVPTNDSLQRMVANTLPALANARLDSLTGRTVSGTVNLPRISAATPEIIPSPYVFTNPFTGHINIELPGIPEHQYAIRFFDGTDKLVLDLVRVPEATVVLDKRNFQKKGIFRFEILRDQKKWEKGYVSVY